MRTARSFLAFFASLFLLAPSIGLSQSTCAPVSNNPLVMANLCSPAPAIDRTNPTGPARPPVTLTVEQADKMVLDSSPLIHPGDFLLKEANEPPSLVYAFLPREIALTPKGSQSKITFKSWTSPQYVCSNNYAMIAVIEVLFQDGDSWSAPLKFDRVIAKTDGGYVIP